MGDTYESPSLEQYTEQLNAVKSKRGYLLPHHGLLALTAPDLLARYDDCYAALTLEKRHLSEHDKEFIWLGVLIAREAFRPTQHLSNFVKSGGTTEEVLTITRLVAIARGVPAFHFTAEYWSSKIPQCRGRSPYLNTLLKMSEDTPIQPHLLHLVMLAVHTSLRNQQEVKWHISWCYEHNVPEFHIAETLSYTMFTGSMPYFIDACDSWRSMIIADEITASEPFRLWASTDQSGPNDIDHQ